MSTPRIIVVGLGPGPATQVTPQTRELLLAARVARLRTGRHPAASEFSHIETYDHLYDTAASFEDLYVAITDDLVALARQAADAVVFAVPGSPAVAERTVELLRERSDVEVLCVPALSVIDAACAAVGCDAMSAQLRVTDALNGATPLRGPGPLLVLQTYSLEILALLFSRLPAATPVVVLHHLGLPDEKILSLDAAQLTSFGEVDHLTSVWVPALRTAGEALEELIDLTSILREKCVWDQEQTHDSLRTHLLEESYEVLDALDRYVVDLESNPVADAGEVVEELGDLLFQILFHAELGRETDQFDFVTIAEAVHEKLVARHPHVFGDVVVNDADDAAQRWEELKRQQKGRQSVLDGVPFQLPSLALYAKLRSRTKSLAWSWPTPSDSDQNFRDVAQQLIDDLPDDPTSLSSVEWIRLMAALMATAFVHDIDLEDVARTAALQLRDEIVAHEMSLVSDRRDGVPGAAKDDDTSE